MAFNLGTSNNSGKLGMSDFLGEGSSVVEKDIPIELLVPWENQPFRKYSEFQLHELAESIKENGLLERVIVCPADGGNYRIIAGHNRVDGCRLAGMTEVPSKVMNVDENRAKLIMVDSNLCQRMEFLPSERAYAYKAQQEALLALNSPRATKAIAEKYGESKRTINRYIACTRLIPELMNMLDEGRFNIVVAERLSGLPNNSQRAIASFLSNPNNRMTEDGVKALADKQFFEEDEIADIISGSAIAKKPKPIEAEEPEEPEEPYSEEDEGVCDNELEEQVEKSAGKVVACDKDEPDIPEAPLENTITEKEITPCVEREIVISADTARKNIGEKYSKKLSDDSDIKQFILYCLGRTDWLKEWIEAMRG